MLRQMCLKFAKAFRLWNVFRQSKRLDFIRHFMCFLSLQQMCLKENTARRTPADLRRYNGVYHHERIINSIISI